MNPIHTLRNTVGLSQEAFAKALDISQSAISQIERNVIRPQPEVAKKIVLFARKNKVKLSFEDIYK